MSKLLPCPFCGGEAKLWCIRDAARGGMTVVFVGCANIDCDLDATEFVTHWEAERFWNTRTPSPQAEDE